MANRFRSVIFLNSPWPIVPGIPKTLTSCRQEQSRWAADAGPLAVTFGES
jgi:hypothetical protein